MGINIVTANFSNGGRDSITRKLYQYDYGQKIRIKGLNLPNTFEVHISNDNSAISAETHIGNNNEIEINSKAYKIICQIVFVIKYIFFIISSFIFHDYKSKKAQRVLY